MGFMDGFTSDGTVDMKHTEYYNLMKEAAKAELLSNAVKAEVPGFYIQAMITGEKPEFLSELKAEEEGNPQDRDCWSCRTCGNTKPVRMDVDKCRECEDGSRYTEADTPDEKSHEMESEEESEEPDNGNE